jgi:myo-inositol 2-dehydrogenase/D-chiro-inositol 1-dehydrogenase
MLDLCLFGAGRIGAIHASNLAQHPGVRLRAVVDVQKKAADALAAKYGAKAFEDPKEPLEDRSINAVLIASSTPTHVDLITRSARAGKAIFCEKPIDLDMGRVKGCVQEIERAKVPFMIGFNRRFDPSFRALKTQVEQGVAGKVEMVTITSRDPRPPPLDYVKSSGGLFRDMMIHDFDTARWLLGEEPVEIFAQASCLVDPAIAEAHDVDTAMVVLKTAGGALCHISNSRRASYGYDQRIEVFGEKGALLAGNKLEDSVTRWTKDGQAGAKPLDFFLERYADAYKAELEHFVHAIEQKQAPSPGAVDGRRALLLAEAALESLSSHRPVEVSRER